MMGYGFGDFGTFGWIGMILNWVITIGLIVGVVLLIAWLVKRVDSGTQRPAASQGTPGASPRDVLQLRYARGEITREQYQQILADLSD